MTIQADGDGPTGGTSSSAFFVFFYGKQLQDEKLVSSMAISLTGNTRQMSAFEASEIAKCTTPAFTGAYWDLGWGWKGAFLACRVDGDADTSSDDMSPIYGFKAKIEAAGYSWPSGRYWIGTDLGDEMTINLNGGNARATFKENIISTEEEIGTAGYIPCLYF